LKTVGFIPSVVSHMIFQIIWIRKGLVALRATIRFFTSMYSSVWL
jgi:hypothetical protein